MHIACKYAIIYMNRAYTRSNTFAFKRTKQYSTSKALQPVALNGIYTVRAGTALPCALSVPGHRRGTVPPPSVRATALRKGAESPGAPSGRAGPSAPARRAPRGAAR